MKCATGEDKSHPSGKLGWRTPLLWLGLSFVPLIAVGLLWTLDAWARHRLNRSLATRLAAVVKRADAMEKSDLASKGMIVPSRDMDWRQRQAYENCDIGSLQLSVALSREQAALVIRSADLQLSQA